MSSRRFKGRRPARAQADSSPWPIVFVVGGLALLGLVAFVLFGNNAAAPAAPIEVKGAPHLKVDRQKVNLGDVKLGQTVEVAFKLTNVGDQPLRFTDAPFVEVAAGC
jgi:hypothetical protein